VNRNVFVEKIKYNSVSANLTVMHILVYHRCLLVYKHHIHNTGPKSSLELLQPLRHLAPLFPKLHLTKHDNPPSPSCDNRASDS
jgi:hypothetical protein